MRSLKLGFGIIGALVPVLYCGALFLYFLNVGGSARDAVSTGLGPTLLGLGAIGVLFVVPLALRILRALPGASPNADAPRLARSDKPLPAPAGEDGFDPDAALARYMARKAALAPAPSPAPLAGKAPGRPSFGRKTG